VLAAAAPQPRGAAAAPDAPPLLEVRGLTAGYGRVGADRMPALPVLRDIDFTIRRGSSLGVIGESGSGKSTLARVIAGLLPAARGQVMLNGEALPPALQSRTPAQLRRIQLVFQSADTALNPRRSVAAILGRPIEFFHGCAVRRATRRSSGSSISCSFPPASRTGSPASSPAGRSSA
jgi:peptide/nickel transport system ATP-binding protein